MLFRLTNAPAIFQVFINNVLRKYLDIFIIIYFNDILIYSQTEKNHKQYISQVLQALQDTNLQVKLEKSVFHVYKLETTKDSFTQLLFTLESYYLQN